MINPELAERPYWYALKVKPNHEKAVAATLHHKGLEEFLPLYGARRAWSDRVKELDLPLFGGYVFCRFPYLNRVPVLRTPGVIYIVGFGGAPVPIADQEIDDIKNLLSSGLSLAPWPFLKVGQRVCIEGGPLRGLEGILLRIRDQYRVIVSVNLLQRSVAVEVSRELVSAVPSNRWPSPSAVIHSAFA